jgi:hypothetical protein
LALADDILASYKQRLAMTAKEKMLTLRHYFEIQFEINRPEVIENLLGLKMAWDVQSFVACCFDRQKIWLAKLRICAIAAFSI